MPAHIDNITALLEPLPMPWFDTDVDPNAEFPRLIITAPSFLKERRAASTMAGARDVNNIFDVKGAGASVESARQTLTAAEEVLDGATGTVGGWRFWITKIGSSPFVSDRDVTLPATNSQVVAGTDTYRYRATPA